MAEVAFTEGAMVLPLRGLTAEDAYRVGPKAANLGELLRAGFSVPEGVVLTADAFTWFVQRMHLDPDSDPAVVAVTTLPREIARELATAVVGLGNGPLAVRSSGLAEDRAEASFAGQYDTILGVRGAEGVLRAVTRCWASAFAPRVAHYRASRGLPFLPVAVLVQRQLEPDAAGVAFSADPVTGERGAVVVSGVRGLADRLVSGLVSPDEWTVRGEEAVCHRAPEGALDANRARAVAVVARQAESHFGVPQDVEWALSGDRVFVLQSRPITALPDVTPVAVDVPRGYWQQDYVATPRFPLDRSVMDPFPARLADLLAEFGLLIQTLEYKDVGGWPYFRFVPVGGKEPPPLPAWLAGIVLPLAARVVPVLRQRARASATAVRTDLAGRTVDRWYQEWLPAARAENLALRTVDLSLLSDDQMLQHLAVVHDRYIDGLDLHFRLIMAMAMAMGELGEASDKLLGWDDQEMMELLVGLSSASSEPAYHLAELAQSARARPLVAEALGRGAALSELAVIDAAWTAEFEDFRREYGCRPTGYVIAEETLAERPNVLLAQLNGQLQQGYDRPERQAELDARRSAARARMEVKLAGRPADLANFWRLLQRAERAYPTLDESQFHLCGVRRGLLRYAAQELGKRLAERDLLARRDDVFFLELGEIRAAVTNGVDSRALVSHRRGARSWALAHPGPKSYGQPPRSPPSLRGLPRALASSMRSLFWLFSRFLGPESATHGDQRTLNGVAAAPGRYTGPVRMVMDETQFGKLQRGDVLVCPITSPVWSVLFPTLGAVVTDVGGILSHPAIIAREHGVPAVVGTHGATKQLRDGQVVTVDGDAGVVLIDVE